MLGQTVKLEISQVCDIRLQKYKGLEKGFVIIAQLALDINPNVKW